MELLAPAGNFEKLITAVHFGADAVYFSGKRFGLRAFAGNFDDEEIVKAMQYLHERGKKGYITLNIVANDEDFVGLNEYLDLLVKAGVDGVIVSDLGVVKFIRDHAPSLNVHVSTQANVNNYYSAKVFADMGATRIVLARELSLKQIKALHEKLGGKVELEAFVHGAMCISYSGRCLLSNYLTGRESNHGACVQACRWKYYIREESRDDEYEMQEDSRGTYILNSKDMNMISHLKEMEEAGVVSLKIEGRMKSAYYVATVVNAYRMALDAKNYEVSEELVAELEKASHRRYSTGFYLDGKDTEFIEDSMPVQTHEFVATVVGKDDDGVVLEMRNRFVEGEELEILSPNKTIFNKKVRMQNMTDEIGEPITDVKGVQQRVHFKTDLPLEVGDILRRAI